MTINIFIARHGEAENAFPDCDRKLTNTGINQAKMVSGFLQKLCPDFESFEKVSVSPYVRAQETAKYILDGINYKEIETESLLVPNADSDLLIGYLEAIIEEEMKAERKRIVDELLAELNEVDRTIITLYYSHDKSDAEISRVVNVPRATVQRRRIKAFEYLKKQISGIF